MKALPPASFVTRFGRDKNMKSRCITVFAFQLICAFACCCANQAANAKMFQQVKKVSECSSIEKYQQDLLQIASETAGILPSNPFIKVNSKNQEQVVSTCIELGLFDLASDYAANIENWRRGKCYGELAVVYAGKGQTDKALEYIKLASETSDVSQQWRNDEIKINVARAYAFLDDFENAFRVKSDLDKESHIVEIYAIKAIRSNSQSDFDELLSQIDKYTSAKEFYAVLYSITALIDVYEHYYSQGENLKVIEDKILDIYEPMPYYYRYRFFRDICKIALSNNDKKRALEFVNKVDSIVYKEKFEWRLEDRIALRAELAALKFKTGAEELAKEELDKIFDMFNAEGEKIVDMFRAEPLRKLAESYYQVGEREKSMLVYGLALAHGVKNPNIRPKAMDLTSTCCSLLVNRIELDEYLLTQIKEVYKDLK